MKLFDLSKIFARELFLEIKFLGVCLPKVWFGSNIPIAGFYRPCQEYLPFVRLEWVRVYRHVLESQFLFLGKADDYFNVLTTLMDEAEFAKLYAKMFPFGADCDTLMQLNGEV